MTIRMINKQVIDMESLVQRIGALYEESNEIVAFERVWYIWDFFVLATLLDIILIHMLYIMCKYDIL